MKPLPAHMACLLIALSGGSACAPAPQPEGQIAPEPWPLDARCPAIPQWYAAHGAKQSLDEWRSDSLTPPWRIPPQVVYPPRAAEGGWVGQVSVLALTDSAGALIHVDLCDMQIGQASAMRRVTGLPPVTNAGSTTASAMSQVFAEAARSALAIARLAPGRGGIPPMVAFDVKFGTR
jgi:hypothetical protein